MFCGEGAVDAFWISKIYQRFIKFNDMCLAELKYVLGRRESSAGLFVRGRNKFNWASSFPIYSIVLLYSLWLFLHVRVLVLGRDEAWEFGVAIESLLN